MRRFPKPAVAVATIALLAAAQLAQAGLPLYASASASRARRGQVSTITASLSSPYAAPAGVPVGFVVSAANLPPRTIGIVNTGGDGRARCGWTVSSNPNVDNVTATVVTLSNVFNTAVAQTRVPIG